MSDGEDDLVAKVKEWVQNHGYPLEMVVARTFRRHGAVHVEQSTYHVDVVTGKVRESDVLATWSGLGGGPSWVYFFFVIECKTSENPKPWVIFTDDQAEELDSKTIFALTPHRLHAADIQSFSHHLHQRFIELEVPIMIEGVPLGYGVTESLRTKDGAKDPAFDAVRQAAASAFGILGEFDMEAMSDDAAMFAFPVVVTTSPIYICRSDSDKGIRLEKVDIAAVSIRVDTQPEHTLVHVVQESGLERFASICAKSGATLGRLLPSEEV